MIVYFTTLCDYIRVLYVYYTTHVCTRCNIILKNRRQVQYDSECGEYQQAGARHTALSTVVTRPAILCQAHVFSCQMGCQARLQTCPLFDFVMQSAIVLHTHNLPATARFLMLTGPCARYYETKSTYMTRSLKILLTNHR